MESENHALQLLPQRRYNRLLLALDWPESNLWVPKTSHTHLLDTSASLSLVGPSLSDKASALRSFHRLRSYQPGQCAVRKVETKRRNCFFVFMNVSSLQGKKLHELATNRLVYDWYKCRSTSNSKTISKQQSVEAGVNLRKCRGAVGWQRGRPTCQRRK